MPTPIRATMLALAGLHLTATLLAALVGSFADGGDVLSRLLLTFVHPACAAALVALAATPRPSRGFALSIAVALAANIAADATAALAIATGIVEGDWWLPMIFSIVPAIGIAYALRLRSDRSLEIR